MVSVGPKMRFITALNTLSKSFSTLKIIGYECTRQAPVQRARYFLNPPAFFHTTEKKLDLMEFFDEKDNWGAREVKVGRGWRQEELRIKSNSDLHKLWFVLLKEKNMLLTMEHEAKERWKLFPNPERLDKVNDSMKNIEIVVRERNQAYFKLETGESGERPGEIRINPLGLPFFLKKREYTVPKYVNTRWHIRHFDGIHRGHAVRKFLSLYKEKLLVRKRTRIWRQEQYVMGLLKRFPHLETSTLQKAYPDVDVEKLLTKKETLGHHEHNKA